MTENQEPTPSPEQDLSLDSVIDMTGIAEEAKPFMQAAVFVAAAAQQIAKANRALSMTLSGQANALFDIVEVMSGREAPNRYAQKSCGDGGCENCGGIAEPSAEVHAEIEDLVKDIEGMISDDKAL